MIRRRGFSTRIYDASNHRIERISPQGFDYAYFYGPNGKVLAEFLITVVGGSGYVSSNAATQLYLCGCSRQLSWRCGRVFGRGERDTLIGSEQSGIVSYVIGPLDMLASLERNLGVNERSHPKAVNRMQHFLDRRGDSIDEASRRAISEIVSRDIGAIRYLEQSGNAGFLGVSADESRAALTKLQTLYTACLDPSVASEKDTEDADLWDFVVSYFWHDGKLTPEGRVPRAT